MKPRLIWLRYSKTFAGSPLSTDKKAKHSSTAPKTPHDLISFHLPNLPITTFENHTWHQAIHHSLHTLGSLLLFLCLCAYCYLPADGSPSTSTMQNPVIIQGPGKYLTFHEGSIKNPIQAFVNGVDPASSHIAAAFCLDPSFSNRSDFAPLQAFGNLWNLEDTSDCQNRKSGGSGSLWHPIETKDAAGHHMMHRTALHNKGLLSPKCQ